MVFELNFFPFYITSSFVCVLLWLPYLVNMDESYNVKHIRVVQNYKEKTFNGINLVRGLYLTKILIR
jgi:hypothetical protein